MRKQARKHGLREGDVWGAMNLEGSVDETRDEEGRSLLGLPASNSDGACGAAWERVDLGSRDLRLLAWVHEQKFLTYEQAARWFPRGAPNPHAQRSSSPTAGALRRRRREGSGYLRERLRKLVHFGYLERVPIFTAPIPAIVLGRQGLAALQAAGRDLGLARLSSIDWKSFEHDRQVTDLRLYFEDQLGGTWTSERALRRAAASRFVPDAHIALRGKVIALELERTRKSTGRYISIIRRYIRQILACDAVLYVVPRESDLEHIFDVVLPAALRSGELWDGAPRNLERFKFTTRAALPTGKVWWTDSQPAEARKAYLNDL